MLQVTSWLWQYEDCVFSSLSTCTSAVERPSKMADRFERHEQAREEMSHGSPVWTRVLAIGSKHPPARERGYIPQGNLWSYLHGQGEDMRKWNGKPTCALAAWVHELRGRTTITGNPSRINATPVSSGQVFRQTRRADVTSYPLEVPSVHIYK